MSSVAGPNRVGSLWVYGFEGGRSVRKTCGMAARKSHAPDLHCCSKLLKIC